MLETVACSLVLLWLLGMMTDITFGGYLHALLAIGALLLLVKLELVRRPRRRGAHASGPGHRR